MKRYLLALACLAWLLGGCGTGTAPQSGSFQLEHDGAHNAVQVGGSLELPILIRRSGGFRAPVQLRLLEAPAGLHGSFQPNPASGNQATLTLTASSQLPPGNYPLTVQGEAAGIRRSLQLTLEVIGQAADFALQLHPTHLTLAPGNQGELVLSVRGNDGPVTLSAEAPDGLTVSFADNPITDSTRATVRAAPSLASGSYQLTVRGQSGALQREAHLSVIISGQGTAALQLALATDNAAIPLPARQPGALSASAQAPPSARPAYVPRQLLVRYRDEALSLQRAGGDVGAALSRLEAAVAREHGLVRLSALDGPWVRYQTDDLDAALAALRRDPRVAAAEPNYYIYPLALPSDPRLSEQWPLAVAGVPVSWQLARSSDVTIAVIDTGIDLDHPELQGVFVGPGRDFCASDSCQSEDDDVRPDHPSDTHGTHVTGIIAARGNSGQIAGVLYGGARILPLKVFYHHPQHGPVATVEAVSRAIRYAVGEPVGGRTNPHPARILNLSLGTTEDSAMLREAIEAALARGALIIAAAGNDGRAALRYPARYDGVIAVGSVNSRFARSCFSNYGPGLDLLAGGGDGIAPIAACRERADEAVLSTFPAGGYGLAAGTSMAAPLVSGIAALFWGKQPDLSAAEVAKRLRQASLPTEDGAGVLRSEALFGLPVPGDRVTVTLSGAQSASGSARLRWDGTAEPLRFAGLTAGRYRLEAVAQGAARALGAEAELELAGDHALQLWLR